MIKKKELDLNSLLKNSFKQTLKHQDLVKEQQENNLPELNIDNLLTKLEITEEIFTSSENREISFNEALYKEIFKQFCSNDIVVAFKKINDSLGINITEQNIDLGATKFSILTPSVTEIKLSKSEIFLSLGIYKTLMWIFEQEGKVAGSFFENFLAGLTNSQKIGQEGGVVDVLSLGSIKTVLPKDTSIKLSFSNTVDHLLQKGKLNNLITLKNYSEDSLDIGLFSYDITLQNFVEYLSISDDFKKTFKAGPEQFNLTFLKLYFGPTYPKAEEEFKKSGITYSFDITNLLQWISNNKKLTEVKSSAGQFEIGNAGSVILLARNNPAAYNYKFLGATKISKKLLLNALKNSSNTLNEDLQKLLKPLLEAYYLTNRFMYTTNINFIREADIKAKTFSNNASEMTKSAISENLLNLTEEAVIVMEMLKRMEG